MFRTPLSLILLASLAALAGGMTNAPVGQSQNQKTTDSGVYNAVQADRGEKVYAGTCAACHVTSEYNSDSFRRVWQGQNVFALFDIISETMPQDDPGGLPRQAYVDVVAYLLRLNGAPAGTVELPADSTALARIKFTWRK